MKIIHARIVYALAAAALFGASTPFAKLLGAQATPVMMAGLLYLGSGFGLSCWYIARRLLRGSNAAAGLRKCDLPWLAGWRHCCRRDCGANIADDRIKPVARINLIAAA